MQDIVGVAICDAEHDGDTVAPCDELWLSVMVLEGVGDPDAEGIVDIVAPALGVDDIVCVGLIVVDGVCVPVGVGAVEGVVDGVCVELAVGLCEVDWIPTRRRPLK